MISPDALMTEPCTIKMRTEDGAPDRYGNPAKTVVDYPTRCFAEQRSTAEAGPENQKLSARWKMLCPATTPITGWDAVEIAGRSYEIIGYPWYVRNPRTSAVSHVEADLETTS